MFALGVIIYVIVNGEYPFTDTEDEFIDYEEMIKTKIYHGSDTF